MSVPPARRRLAFSALILATIIAVLDISAVNLALPSIAADLGLSIEQALWLSKANLLVCAITILPCAALADLIGHRRMLSIGLITFAATSIGTALASDLGLLIALRALQGLAGAIIMCSTLVLMREIFPPTMLGAALGINALFVAVATTTGPMLSGVILSFVSWRWVFVTSPVLALFAFTFCRIYLPEKRSEAGHFDLTGMVLLASCATILLVWHLYPTIAWLGGLGVFAALLFVQQQRLTRCPFLPLILFHDLRFSCALTASVIAFIGQSSVFIALPLVLQQNNGFTPVEAAALLLPWPLLTAIIGPWAGKYSDQCNPRILASVGIAILASGLAALALLDPHPAPLQIAWRMAACGVGFGLFQSPNNREILTNVLPGHAARAAALLSTARLLGQALGAAFVAMPLIYVPKLSPLAPAKFDVSNLLWGSAALQVGSLLLAALFWVFSRRAPAGTTSVCRER